MQKRDEAAHLNAYLSGEVRGHRLRLGLTLREMDQALGVSSGTFARLERGDKRLDVVTLWKLADLVGQPVDQFFDTAPRSEAEPFMTARLGIDSEEIAQFIKAYRAVTKPSARREILALVRTLAESADHGRPLTRQSLSRLAEQEGGA